MSVNLATKYETKLDERYQAGSFTDKWTGNNYNWDGVNSIKIWTLLTDDLNDYNNSASSNRFGTPSEVSDEVNVYTLQKKRSFSKVFDETNIQDTMFIRKANTYLKQMWDERYVPEIDKYRLTTWANGAGNVTIAAALTKSTIVAALRVGIETLDNANVPTEGRVIFMKPAMVTAYMLSSEMQYQQAFLADGVIKGQVGNFSGCPIVQVPDSRLPDGLHFMIKYKQASADPMKLRMLRVNTDAPGFCGSLMEGLCRYDSFVLAQKADGIYCHFLTAKACTAPTFSRSTSTLSIASSDSGTIKYTTDGSNPKTSPTAATYSSGITVAVGDKVRAYVEKSGLINSGIAAYDVTSIS